MTTIATARPTIQRPDTEVPRRRCSARRGGVPGPLQRSDPRRLSPRPAGLLPVGRRQPGTSARSNSPPHRAVPLLDGPTRPGSVNDRPAALDGLRLLPIRPHRRPHRVEPGPVRPPPASTLRMPADWTAPSWVCSCSPQSSTTATTRRSPCCAGSTGCGSARPAPPTSRTWASNAATAPCASSARATSPPPSRSCPARRAPSTSPSATAAKGRSCTGETASASTSARRTGGCVPSASELAWARSPPHAPSRVHHGGSLDAGVPLRDVEIAARHADPHTTTIYDRRRQNFDRHAAYVVVAFVAGV
jgi:hypothetical protein